MTEKELAQEFERHRGRLRALAYRMLGGLGEADDVVQEAWLRLARNAEPVVNLGGWLTTVVSRLCLDELRARSARQEEGLGETLPASARDPEAEAALLDEVGLALMVVLARLEPAERLAFVLHDLLGMPFEEVAEAVGRSAEAARQLASRARRRVQGESALSAELRAQQKGTIARFIAALRAGDVEGMVALMLPEVSVEGGVTRAARDWAKGAVAYAGAARWQVPILVDGALGLAMAPRGQLMRVLRFTFDGERIAGLEVLRDPAGLELAVP